jgi:hypothetical protein
MTAILNKINMFCNEAYSGAGQICKFVKEQTPKSIQNLNIQDAKTQEAAGHAMKLLAFSGGCFSTYFAAKTLLGFSAISLPTTAALLMVSGVSMHDAYKIGSELTKTFITNVCDGNNIRSVVKDTILYQAASALYGAIV